MSDRILRRRAADAEPRWPALVAALAIGGLNYALPEPLTVGPGWLVLALVALFMLLSNIAYHTRLQFWNDVFAYGGLSVITLAEISSLALLLMRLPQHKDPPIELLKSAAALWVSNILVFASWYWRLDGGGPNERDKRGVHTDGAFLFPQMSMDPALKHQTGEECWSPGFIDYLFLAFNTSTAFSPTDVPVLSRWAKAMMIVQSLISLATVALLAARAVNIL